MCPVTGLCSKETMFCFSGFLKFPKGTRAIIDIGSALLIVMANAVKSTVEMYIENDSIYLVCFGLYSLDVWLVRAVQFSIPW